MAAWHEERDRLREQDAALKAQSAEIQAADDAALAAWKQARDEAVATGEPIPPRPIPLDRSHVNDAWASVRNRMRFHAEEKAQAVAADADAVEEAVKAQEVERQAEIAAMAAQIRRWLSEAAEASAVMREVARAIDKAAGISQHPSRADRIPGKPDLDMLLDAAVAGRSLLDPRPLMPREPQIQAVEDPLGFTRPNEFGYDDADRPAPPALPNRPSLV